MAKRKTAAKSKEPTFEDAMERLEGIVRELEEADLPLEKSLEIFEEGVRLSRLLNRKLGEAEAKVEILLGEKEGEKETRPFGTAEEGDAVTEAEDEDDTEQGGLPF